MMSLSLGSLFGLGFSLSIVGFLFRLRDFFFDVGLSLSTLGFLRGG